MTDELESILARVASGELSPEAAEPLVAAAAGGDPPAWSEAPTTVTPSAAAAPTRAVRIRVTDGGRQVVVASARPPGHLSTGRLTGRLSDSVSYISSVSYADCPPWHSRCFSGCSS